MRFTDWRLRGGLAGLSLLAGCSAPAPPPEAGASSAPTQGERAGAASGTSNAPVVPVEPGKGGAVGPVKLPPPGPVRGMDEVRLQAALRMVAANPHMTYRGEVPEPLLAIPVLEIELNADGSIRRIVPIRLPSQARDTTQLAIDAVRRAAPFGNVSKLPKPWRFVETFLFNDDRKFKPRSLD